MADGPSLAWEAAANTANAASIVLAARNSVHTWWTGILGCALFAWVFFYSRLYADVTLQLFFIGASLIGWRAWTRKPGGAALPIRHARRSTFLLMTSGAIAGAVGYGWLLHRFTDAFAPFADSAVLTFSILGQLLLIRRLYESWWCWLIVNTISVPVLLSRGLTLTAILYVGFWINGVIALVRWRRLIVP